MQATKKKILTMYLTPFFQIFVKIKYTEVAFRLFDFILMFRIHFNDEEIPMFDDDIWLSSDLLGS